jgi:hypothetical protein
MFLPFSDQGELRSAPITFHPAEMFQLRKSIEIKIFLLLPVHVHVHVHIAMYQDLDLTFGQLPCLCRGVILNRIL